MQAGLIVSTHQHLLQVALLEVVLSGWGSLLNNERGRLPHTSLTADQGYGNKLISFRRKDESKLLGLE